VQAERQQTPSTQKPLWHSLAPPQASPVPGARIESFADVVALAGQRRELKLKHALETAIRLIRFETGRIEIGLTDDAPSDLAGELAAKLDEWTGRRWMIAVGRDGEAPTIAEQRRTTQARLVSDARADPVVAAVMAEFPGAEIVDVRVRADAEQTPAFDSATAPPPDDMPDEED
jgi:DNA polymerase-3 subunit gamma/tau